MLRTAATPSTPRSRPPASLGVVEPYSCGIGGGGFMPSTRARDGKVDTIDWRETAPGRDDADRFVDGARGSPTSTDRA